MGSQEMTKEEKRALIRWTMGLGNMNKVMFEGKSPLPDKSIIATSDSWQIHSMPEQHIEIPLDLILDEGMMETIRKGHIPEEMEDHWFMYCDDNCIRYYRSWHGECVFEAYYKHSGKDYKINRLIVNRNSEEYNETNPLADVILFQILLITELGGWPEDAWNDYFKAKGM